MTCNICGKRITFDTAPGAEAGAAEEQRCWPCFRWGLDTIGKLCVANIRRIMLGTRVNPAAPPG